MAPKRVLQSPDEIVSLAQRLTRVPDVSSFDEQDEPEAWALAHTLSDLEESFETALHKLMPKLVRPGITNEELDDVLLDIGEELRHILYHIENSKFYGYLLPPKVEV